MDSIKLCSFVYGLGNDHVSLAPNGMLTQTRQSDGAPHPHGERPKEWRPKERGQISGYGL